MKNTTYTKVPTQKITASNGVTYAYRDLGDPVGVPLVAVTHLSANLDNWDPEVIDGLAQNQRVITFDYQGVGSSSGHVPTSIQGMASDTLNFIKAMHLTKVNLLGFSMGGMVVQEMLLQQPKLAQHVILAGTGPRGGEGIENVTKISDMDLVRAIFTLTDIKTTLFFTRTENGKTSAKQFLKRLKRRQQQRDRTISWVAYRRQLKAINRWGRAEPADLSGITQPVLILNGDHDRMVPTDPNTYDLHRQLTNSELVIYPDAGHGSIFQNGSDFVRRANAFLAQ
ncbi:alpha/beta fold hydrolase [Lactiplantibacillus daoliensis]|uniref:Alpha/beta fold hydrolase n=1 Tax=Lactiplantibacillus daoliensis TaxID=2559916 RepID=A0ABW1UE80_9LACO|nr:alpha/beta hydrolase [Lactiplantibacillus daoliensis]